SVPAPDRVGNRTTLPLRTALPGRQQKFDITGGDPVGPSTRLQIVSRQPHELGGFHGVRARADPRPSALVHIPDVLADPEYAYGAQSLGGYRAMLGVPLL